MNDISITILENGNVRIDTDQIGGPEHMAAEKALQWIASELGGNTTRTRRNQGHVHNHDHAHNHDHNHTH